jgi:hypothetical protein
MYYFHPFRDAVVECSSKYGKDAKRAALASDLIQLTAASTAYAQYGAANQQSLESGLELALSYAWEDLQIAFNGFGNSHMTGVVLNWWEEIDTRFYSDCRVTLNRGSMEANDKTSKSAKRRYLSNYRSRSVRTPTQGFDLPQAMPCWGPGLTQWHADAYEVDLDTLKVFLAHIEEQERLGLTVLNVSETTFMAEGGTEFSTAGAVDPNPFWKDQQGKPSLKLVT